VLLLLLQWVSRIAVERAPPIRGELLPIDGKKITKSETLAAAGISTTTDRRTTLVHESAKLIFFCTGCQITTLCSLLIRTFISTFTAPQGARIFKLLERLEKVHDKVISSAQVEMEFQKNRQKRMLEAFQKLKLPGRPEIPGLFANSPVGEELQTLLDQIDKKLEVLKARLSAAMKSPAKYDPVYKVAKQIFSFESDFNLTRAKPERFQIRRLAPKRFLLGYPPRKNSDTSIGDAVNWEWIVECAKKSDRSVVIVTRDGDYGLRFDRQSYLNEWLRQEFSERVGGKNQITLTESLSDALEKLKVHVTKAERDAETILIDTAKQHTLAQIFPWPVGAESGSGARQIISIVENPIM
jgi:hypothetical protein